MFVDKDLESKIQVDLHLDQECCLRTEVESFKLKALVAKSPFIVSAFGRL